MTPFFHPEGDLVKLPVIEHGTFGRSRPAKPSPLPSRPATPPGFSLSSGTVSRCPSFAIHLHPPHTHHCHRRYNDSKMCPHCFLIRYSIMKTSTRFNWAVSTLQVMDQYSSESRSNAEKPANAFVDTNPSNYVLIVCSWDDFRFLYQVW